MQAIARALRRSERTFGRCARALSVVLGAGVIGGCAVQQEPVATEEEDRPILGGAVEFVQPVWDGAVAVVEPVVDGVVGVGRGFVNLMFLDGGGRSSGPVALAGEGSRHGVGGYGGGGDMGGAVVSFVNLFLPK